jgi:small GTP-binding protein
MRRAVAAGLRLAGGAGAAARGAAAAAAPPPLPAAARALATAPAPPPLPDEMLPVVAIVGRPNVGKSALFNRLARRRGALVADTPGGHVTRDWQEAPARLGDLRFRAVDTSGLEPFGTGDAAGARAARARGPGGGAPGGAPPRAPIQARAAALTARVLGRADVALLLVDGAAGVAPADAALARWLRAAPGGGSRVVLVANKCDRRGRGAGAGALAEASELGFGAPVAVSAQSGEGMADLYAALRPRLDPLLAARAAAVAELRAGGAAGLEAGGAAGAGAAAGEGGSDPHASSDREAGALGRGPLKVAVMGLTNVGKSTLLNALLGEERVLTGPEPGLTRDAIAVRTRLGPEDGGGLVELVDTAGWVRRVARLPTAADDDGAGPAAALAAAALGEAATVLRFVHVVLLVVDAERVVARGEGFTHAEATLAARAAAEGRALVLAANKLDALPPPAAQRALELLAEAGTRAAPDAGAPRVLGVSALRGDGVAALLPAAADAYARWRRRVPTAGLNRWVGGLTAGAATGGGPAAGLRRLKYVTQVKARPPSFVAWVSGTADFPEAARRHLANRLRADFGFEGVPLRLVVRRRERKAPPSITKRRRARL